jgi:pyruvate/2-oxoglutarate dehydrogenase complex dihydrolipoamide acyltransferase (E2) component
MAFPITAPRVNNNDDEVRLVHVYVKPGTFVNAGTAVAEIETDKATVTVEAEKDGYVLTLCDAKNGIVKVGQVLMWMGERADELPPRTVTVQTGGQLKAPTLRAAMLISKHGLDASAIAAKGERITVDDVERYIAKRTVCDAAGKKSIVQEDMPPEPGQLTALDPLRRGMLRTVAWQKANAVPGYVELSYDDTFLTNYAAEFQKNHKLLLSPLLSLLSWRLVQVVKDRPQLNTTIVRGQRYGYDNINLGFTVQSGNDLYVIVVRSAETMEEATFVNRLGELQRSAMKKVLSLEETQGATIGLTSMARWQASRHVPILLPHTALMVAHTATREGTGIMGATYDHRVLTGADAILALQQLVKPQAR